ncbi:MAG: hypothetical protein IT316_04475 [Anaerolineales bacterium]|nr:hypothetical protein [Anaerolineales bacterium]
METRKFLLGGAARSHPLFKTLLCIAAALLLFGPASAHAHFPGAANSPEAAPDLVITDIWDGGPLPGSPGAQICYQVYNRGDARTNQPFDDGLKVDNVAVSTDPVPILDPGQRYDSCFNYSWSCLGAEDIISAGADIYDGVSESNELNNTRTETWKCDGTAPKITSGPAVNDITTTSAKISWTTDESSSSDVYYDTKANTFGQSKTDPQPVTPHQVELTGLAPATLYQYKAVSADVSGNQVESPPGFFKTRPTADSQKPDLSNYKAERGPGDTLYYRVSIDAADNDAIAQVEFFLDGQLIGIDYAPDPDNPDRYQWDIFPGLLGMDMSEFNAVHDLAIEAYDRFGNKAATGVLEFIPSETFDGELEFLLIPREYDYMFYGPVVPYGTKIPLRLKASQYYQDCRLAHVRGPDGEFTGCIQAEKAVDYVEIRIDGNLVYTAPSYSYVLIYDYNWSIGGMGAGRHIITADAYAGEMKKQTSVRINFVRGEAVFHIERTVTQDDHQFRIGLRISNSGTRAAKLFNLTDNLDGFQPISKSTGYYDTGSLYSPDTQRNTFYFNLHCGVNPYCALNPGDHLDLEYLAAPALYYRHTHTYVIGNAPVELKYAYALEDPTTVNFDLRTTTTAGGGSLVSAINDIQMDSDYLVVTNPTNLFAFNASGGDVNRLLAGLAKLANAKDGVLAYLIGSPHAEWVDGAIETWGSFMKGSDGIPDHFLSNGYALLVGETDIIPAFSKTLKPPGDVAGLLKIKIDPTDMYYADTSGKALNPELNLGRIPGDNAAKLLIPVETITGVTSSSAGYGFNWSDALIMSGFSSSRDGGSDYIDFARERNEVESRLDDHVARTVEFHTPNYATHNAARDAFNALLPDKDILHMAGHGSYNHLDDVWESELSGLSHPFRNANPFVYGNSCKTADYTRGTSLAEAFLSKGAGLYLGSTETAYFPAARNAAKKFYSHWDPGEAVGPVVKYVKRNIGGAAHFYEDIWKAEYHLLGDPEYGFGAGVLSPAAAPPELRVQGPLELVDITIPDYTLTQIETGQHQAEIPGGFFVMRPGKPMAPTYSFRYKAPAGTVVQNVIMTGRGGLKTASGIDLVTFEPVEAGAGGQPLAPDAQAEWFPTADFDWRVDELPDGSSELYVVIYPFFYNSLTRTVNFYTAYQFNLITASSSVHIPLLDTDAPVYDPGDTVRVEMVVSASGGPQTVTVSAAVYALGSDELVEGLLVDTLSHLRGAAAYALSWDSSEADVGDYYVTAELHDLQGHLLGAQTEPFSLGAASGAARDLSAPAHFNTGASVPLDFWFENTGTVPITGTAVIRVEGLNSGGLSEFRVPITNLQPLASAHISETWCSAGKPADDYQVTAYVLFEGQTTPALIKLMESTYKLRMPLVRRG